MSRPIFPTFAVCIFCNLAGLCGGYTQVLEGVVRLDGREVESKIYLLGLKGTLTL